MRTIHHLVTLILAWILIHLRWKRNAVLCNAKFLQLSCPEDLYPRLIHHICREFLLVLWNQNPEPQYLSTRAQELLPELQKGGLLLTAHFGNWEWMGPWLRSLGAPLIATYKPLHNPLANRLMQSLRNRNGDYTVPLSLNPFSIRSLFQHHSLFTLLADQDYRGTKPFVTSFFGHTVQCNPLPATILRLFPESPVFVACVYRNEQKHLTLDIVRISPTLPTEVYAQYHQVIEQWIQDFPDQWIGLTHRRFLSTQPSLYSQPDPCLRSAQ